ncbi:MAG TPA: hypothetical protein PLS83_12205 [Methanothrix soehngenii]|nr:hypothetical protein [Methanothrix soehngenii]
MWQAQTILSSLLGDGRRDVAEQVPIPGGLGRGRAGGAEGWRGIGLGTGPAEM